ncbi:unnamed protein product [Toxocara canis]|uniref:Peroxisomal membrane protein 4 n=1 Tax=Toxocara canis TaxID=6265 RepID=A0A183V5B5_TOXCA|nr:unnamed protein product [Toxocara canis]
MDVVTLIRNWELIANYALFRLRRHHYLLAALKGLRNGIVYGTRIRAPHAFVMVFLFGNGTFFEKVKTILRLTRIHATNLASFVFTYKLLTGLMQRMRGSRSEWHSFLAAFIVGYFVFGDNNGVNMQVFCFSEFFFQELVVDDHCRIQHR